MAQPGPDTQPGRRLTADVLNRVREVLRLPRRGHGAGQPQLPVMPRPRQAGALLCGRRVGVCNADPFPFPRSPFPSAYGLSSLACPTRWRGRSEGVEGAGGTEVMPLATSGRGIAMWAKGRRVQRRSISFSSFPLSLGLRPFQPGLPHPMARAERRRRRRRGNRGDAPGHVRPGHCYVGEGSACATPIHSLFLVPPFPRPTAFPAWPAPPDGEGGAKASKAQGEPR